jgi:hypothetical protein
MARRPPNAIIAHPEIVGTAGVGSVGVGDGANVAVKVGVGGVPVTVGVGDGGVPVTVGVGEGAGLHAALETGLLVSIVTAPFRARALPGMLALVFSVMLVRARMFPANAVSVPSVAELPTCQNTLQLDPALLMRTLEWLAVVSVLPILKTKIAEGLP